MCFRAWTNKSTLGYSAASSKLHLAYFGINCKFISKFLKCKRVAIAGLAIDLNYKMFAISVFVVS